MNIPEKRFSSSGLWSSREMLKDNSDAQLYVKITLRELILYAVFMIVIIYREH